MPTLRELASRVTTLDVASRDELLAAPEMDPDLSTGSIDLGGAMLKMFHNTLGVKQKKSSERDDLKEPRIPACPEWKEGTDLETTEATTQDGSTELREENISGGIASVDSSQEKSMNDKSSGISGSMIDLSESSSASIDSISVRSLQLDDIKNIITSDGRLDTEKLANLPFPSINISKSLEKSFAELKKTRGSKKKENQPPHSTPVSTGRSRRPTRRSKRHADEREKMNALLKDLNIYH